MLPFKRTFDSEKQQLQELNSRLAQYLSRTKQLEQENAHLIAEINKLRQTKTAEWEPKYKAEMRDLRRMVGQLSLEKSQAEMEREKLWRELQMVQSMCSEQTVVCRDISGELKDCEKELHNAHKTNGELEKRLFQLQTEYKRLEGAHIQEMDHLRRQVEARVVPILTQTYRGPQAVSMEEVQEYARRKVEEMEQEIKADQAMLNELQREKMLYASELDKLRTEAEKQGHIQMRMEEQLMHMQDKFRVDLGEYQMIIEQLEQERNAMANTIAEKMREHQHLLQVKMDLGMEVAAYRALLEGERVGLQDAQRRVNQHQRERIIAEEKITPIKSSTAEIKSVKVVSPQMMSLGAKIETESKKQLSGETERDHFYDGELKDKERTGPGEKKILDSVSVEEIIEKVMRPAGMEAQPCSSGESKIVYHVEKTQQQDGTTKTQIVLESKVEEELDISEDSALEELLSQGVKKVSLQDIKDTATGSMIENLLSGLQGAENLQNKSVNVEIIEEPVDSFSDEEIEFEHKSRSTSYEPSSTYFQIEELENVPRDAHVQRSDDVMKTSMGDADHSKGGSVHVEEVSRQSESSYFSHDQEPHEYYVSTPDDNLSEPEEGGGITSYGHYGVVDDLSDERYYQDESLPLKRVIVEESDEYKFTPGDHSFVKESFPECIIEEEVRVSPVVQESVLGFLREDTLEPKEQLRGALEKLQSSVSGPLREELAFLSKVSSESSQNVAVDVKKVEQSTDNGTMTIVAELNVSQTLEDSGLLEAEGDLSDEQIMAALRSSNLGLEKAFQGGAGGYSFKVTKEEDVVHGEELEGYANITESVSEITEKHIKLGPSEKSFTFQMDVQSSHSEVSPKQELQSQIPETQ
ncbi:hypothetical protein INR49_007824, partial [Caranx melampygus]